MTKTFFLASLTAVCILNSVNSQEKPAYDFLRVDASARASALAGAFETATDDPNAMFYNPASISTIEKRKISAGFQKLLLDINSGSLSYNQKYKDVGWFGIGVRYFNYGKFDYIDENGNNLGGTFGANDLMISVGYSNLIYDKVNYGISAKFIHSKIAQYGSSAIAFDIGLMYLIPSQHVNIGLSVNNMGKQLDAYSTTKERLPLDVRLGFSKRLEHLPLRVSLSLSNLNESKDKFYQRLKSFSIGGEFLFSENFNIRIGYNNQERQDFKLGTSLGLSGFSAGIGLKFAGKYAFDYSLNALGKVGSTHRFNLGYTFE